MALRVRVPRIAEPSASGITGDASGTLDFSGSAVGVVRVAGAVVCDLPLSGAAAGAVRVAGTASGDLPLSGSGAGAVLVRGAALGALALQGAAAATVAIRGQGVAAIGFSVSGAAEAISASDAVGAAAVWNYQILPGITAKQMLIDVWQSIGTPTAAQIAAAVLSAAEANPIHANAKEMNDATVYGDGSPSNLWRGTP